MKKIFIFLINIYQKTLSPFFANVLNVHCIYTPSCSEYTKQAIDKYGAIKGSFLGIKRIFRCNPWSKGGYDPVP